MTAQQTIFHVQPRPVGWQIIRNGQPRSVFTRKADAIARATLDAKHTRPSTVIIHTTDGHIEDERTYPYPHTSQ
jgi:hypothetical protein